MTVYFWIPDVGHAAGGIRAVYRFTDALNAAGLDAAVLHQAPGFRATWFPNETRVESAATTPVCGNDVLVVSELDAARLLAKAPGVTKVVLNQQQYWTFVRGPVDYLHPDVAVVIAVSEDGVRYLSYAFPGLAPARVRYAVDTDLFHPRTSERERAIAFLDSKGRGPRAQVTEILSKRRALRGWEWRALRGLTHGQMAEMLGRVAILASFSEFEGFQMLLTEAMASGCAVVGFHAGGGREYLTDDVAWPVQASEIVTFAERLEEVALGWDERRDAVEVKTSRAVDFIRERYTLSGEAADIVAAIRPAVDRAVSLKRTLEHNVAEVPRRRDFLRQRTRAVGRALIRG